MKRPDILVRTARIGARHYRADRDQPALVAGMRGQARRTALATLEARCETQRRNKSSSYSPSQHVLALAAMMAEG